MTFSDFFDRLGDLKWLGVIVATVATMVIGALWYGPLFGKLWTRETGQEMESTPDPVKMGYTAAYLFVFNIGIGVYAAVVDDFEHALVMALIIGVLIMGAAHFGQVIWRKDSYLTFAIDTGHWTVLVFASVFVQGLFL